MRRQELLADVNQGDLSVYGAALTQDLSPSKRVTNAEVAVCFPFVGTYELNANPQLISPLYPPTQSYKEQFLLTKRHQRQHKRTSNSRRAATRAEEESLISIADAIRPPPNPRLRANALVAMRRGHSVSSGMIMLLLWPRIIFFPPIFFSGHTDDKTTTQR